MSDEKRPPDKSEKPDSPKEPIDFSGLMNFDEEDDDDIIELTDEVTTPQPSGKENIDEEEVDIDDEEDDDVIPLTQEIDSLDDTDEEEVELPRDLDWDDTLLEDDETEETTDEGLFTLTDDMAIETEENADLEASRPDTAAGLDTEEDMFELSDDLEIMSAGEDQLLKPIDAGPDDDDSNVSLTDEAEIEAPDSDIIEIDEFDEQFPAENFDTADSIPAEEDLDSDEDEFLELIDVEEEGMYDDDEEEDEEENGAVIDLVAAKEVREEEDEPDEEFEDELIDFGVEEEEMEDAEIESFFSEPFDEKDEEIEFDQGLEDEVAESLGIDLDSDMDMSPEESEIAKSLGMNLGPGLEMDEDTDEADQPPGMDFGAAVDMPEEEYEEETIDFNADTDIITDEQEEPGTILFDHSVAEEPPEAVDGDIARADETETADLGTISSRQIEDAIERLIQNNYAEKIESIIVNVIEKAVSKEIQKLKDALLDDISDIETS